MEKAGVPAVAVVTTEFVNLAKTAARSLKYPDLPMVVIPHPFETLSVEKVRQIADEKFNDLVDKLTRSVEVPARA